MECKNCHIPLSETANYCNVCGAKVIKNRLTMGNLFEHFSETFFNYDNTFLQTLIDLIRKPEIVIGSYIDGTRKKYVDVVSYFALAITLSGLQLFILNKFYPDAMDMSQYATKGQEQFQNDIMSFVTEYQSLVMMSYVPIYALIAKLVFLNKKQFNYTELLVIFMYVQAQISIISAVLITSLVILGIDFGILSMFMFPFMIIYAGFCLKRLYRLSVLEMLLKTLIFFMVFGIFVILFVIGFIMVMYFNGDLEALRDAQKAAKQS